MSELAAVHPRWGRLLDWLEQKGMDTSNILVESRETQGAGYGLFALQEIPPSTPLFKVPSKAMLNIRTLAGLYPKAGPKLTATQIMSLHLFLNRPASPSDISQDVEFGPYISILPSNFDAHPLTWLIRHQHLSAEQASLETEHYLLEHMPKGVLNTLENVAMRFRQDQERVCQYLVSEHDNPKLLAGTPLNVTTFELDFLWGWLNVNTRCIYQRLCPTRTDPDNVTMCPVLDFANHTEQSPHTSYPQRSPAELKNEAPSRIFGDDFMVLSPRDKTLYPGEEVFLKYGAHSNRALFTEYGFINSIDPEGFKHGRLDDEADLTCLVLRLFARRGETGTWMEELLKQSGYWGDWTIHSTPEPPHPSFRLISALRLYHSVPLEMTLPHGGHEIVRKWRCTILGECDTISLKNESAWRETLDKLCLEIDNSTGAYLDSLTKVESEWPIDSWIQYMRKCLLMLWREQQRVACLVHISLKNGEEF